MADERVMAALADACFGLHTEEELTERLRPFLAERGVDPADIDAFCNSPPRLALYRRIVRNNVVEVTRRILPRTRARMNAAAGAFDASFDAWLSAEGPRSPFLRDVPQAFFAWAERRWRAEPRLPPWLGDLARLELAELAVSAGERGTVPEALGDVALDGPAAFAAPLRLVPLAYAVHTLPEEDDGAEPPLRPTTLLVYRDDAFVVRFLELTAYAATLLAALLEGATLRAAVTRAAATTGAPATEAVLRDVAALLSDLGQRGVLLGGRPGP